MIVIGSELKCGVMNEEIMIVGCPSIVPESRNGNLGFREMRFI
jgi:hypothetical protein